MKARPSHSSGFTLIEVLIVVVILSIVMAIAIPSLRDMLEAQKVRNTASDLYSALILARSEAMKRNVQVSLVQATGGWANGWTAQWTDSSSVTTVLQTEAIDSSQVTVSGPSASSITYSWTGRPITGSVDASFTVYTGHVAARCVTLRLSGMPEIKVDTDGNPSNGC